MGVFQIESRAQMQSLLRTRPETLDDLTVQVAIVRPGPIVGGAVNPYIDRKQKLRADPHFKVPYEHPSLEPVLKDTLGTIIFQDQVLEVAMAFAGFSPGEAEGLRRAMSRKRSAAAIEGYHERFVQGAARTHGADRETAERVFTMIAGFSGFGFPKAHGAAFGLLAYQSTWLRVHYKPEFTCALLNEQPMGFYPSDTLIHECQRTGIEVLPARRQPLPGALPRGVRGRSRPRHPHRPRLPQRRAGGRGRGDRRRARGARAVRLAGRAGLAGGGGPAGAVGAGLVGRVRLADRRGGATEQRPPHGAVAARGRRARDADAGAARSWRCRSSCPTRRRSSRWRPGSGWWPTTRRPA